MATYKGITINEQTTYQDEVYNSIYLVVEDLSIPSYNAMRAEVMFRLYKSKQS